MNIPSLSVSSVWRLYAWVTVSTSTGTVKCITHWTTHQPRPEPRHSMKSWGRSSTSSRTKQELSPRTSCVSTSAPSMANPMVCLSYSLGFVSLCASSSTEAKSDIHKRVPCKELQWSSVRLPIRDVWTAWLHHLACIICPFFSLFYVYLSLPDHYPS